MHLEDGIKLIYNNLTKEERLALAKLKSSDNVFRIQDKGSRFVIISQNECQDKMLGQLNNDRHYNKLTVFSRLNAPGVYFNLGPKDPAFIWSRRLIGVQRLLVK